MMLESLTNHNGIGYQVVHKCSNVVTLTAFCRKLLLAVVKVSRGARLRNVGVGRCVPPDLEGRFLHQSRTNHEDEDEDNDEDKDIPSGLPRPTVRIIFNNGSQCLKTFQNIGCCLRVADAGI